VGGCEVAIVGTGRTVIGEPVEFVLYTASPDAREIAIKHRIDALYTEHPFYGARRMAHVLGREGLAVDRKTVGHICGRWAGGDLP